MLNEHSFSQRDSSLNYASFQFYSSCQSHIRFVVAAQVLAVRLIVVNSGSDSRSRGLVSFQLTALMVIMHWKCSSSNNRAVNNTK